MTGVEGVPPPPPRGFPVISLWIFSLEERMSLQACTHRHKLKPPHPHTAEHGQSQRADSAAQLLGREGVRGGGVLLRMCQHYRAHTPPPPLTCTHNTSMFAPQPATGRAGRQELRGRGGLGAGCVAAGFLRDPARHIAGQR